MINKLQDRKLFRVAYYYTKEACEVITIGADKDTSYLILKIMAAKIFRKKYPVNILTLRDMRLL